MSDQESSLHPLLRRLLSKSALSPDAPPQSMDSWRELLDRLSSTLEQVDDDRYTLERSLVIVSEEMRELYDHLRVRSESELARERDMLRAVTRSIGDGLIALNAQSKITMVNPAAESLLGADEQELLGRRGWDFVAVRTESFSLGKLIKGETCRGDDAVVRRKDGTVFPASYVVTPVSDGERLIGAVNVFRDITLQKRDTSAMVSARDQALRASRLKSEFLANMSHELRTPLNAIIGYTELLLDMAVEKQIDECTADLRRVLSAGRHLLGLIDDILDLSKIEAGKVELDSVLFDLRELISQVVDTVTPRANSKELQLVTKLDADLPEQLEGDPGRLRQVLINLAGNAVKFTDKGRVHIEVVRQPEGRVRFAVSDTGVGIPPEAQTMIFDAFLQADGSMTRRHGGTGLGLSISKEIVELMGGRIGVDSEPGRGSTFWIELAF